MGDLVQSSAKKSVSADQVNNLESKEACDAFCRAFEHEPVWGRNKTAAPSAGGFLSAVLPATTVYLITPVARSRHF